MRRISSLLLLTTLSSPKDFLVSSITLSWPPGDGKIIILSDSDKEEVCEEKTISIEDAAASTAVNPASTASTDDAPTGTKMIIVMIRAPIRRLAATTTVEVTPTSLRLQHQEGAEAGVL
jgi:hypothetical protein